jgi:hypothetical protein
MQGISEAPAAAGVEWGAIGERRRGKDKAGSGCYGVDEDYVRPDMGRTQSWASYHQIWEELLQMQKQSQFAKILTNFKFGLV